MKVTEHFNKAKKPLFSLEILPPLKGKGIQSLVLTPTRELAEQVKDALKHFSKHHNLKV